MAKELSDELIKDWQSLMTGFKQISSKVPSWSVKVNHGKEVIINKNWSIICHFINYKYIEAKLSFKGDEVMTVKHISKYSTTVSIVLEFINWNKDLK